VLVTGSNGAIGQPVCRELMSRGHRVRGLDRRAYARVSDSLVGDIADFDLVRRAVAGVDAVIHLAATPVPWADFHTEVLPSNLGGAYNVYEAAREAGVKRVVFASSLHVGVRSRPADRPAAVCDGVAPSSQYGLSKIFGEALGEMYARCHGIESIAVRVGFLPRAPEFVDKLVQGGGQDIYLSPGDAGRFFTLAVEATLPPEQKFIVLYAMSKAVKPRYDVETAQKLLRYEPRDTWPEGFAFPE